MNLKCATSAEKKHTCFTRIECITLKNATTVIIVMKICSKCKTDTPTILVSKHGRMCTECYWKIINSDTKIRVNDRENGS